MNENIMALKPKILWNYFADISEIPHPSKHEGLIVKFMWEFGQKLKLETTVDEIGNVIIRKPATSGMENRIPVILQGHLDMVPKKNVDVEFDFKKDPIQTYIDGDWVKAKGTTLGADNGIGVAAAMAILASNDIPHPALECLFTVEEEVGLHGAQALKSNALQGKILLNLDSEEEDELTIGCAGGIVGTTTGRYTTSRINKKHRALQIKISGLTGGHSAMVIHKNRANANKVLNTILLTCFEEFSCDIHNIDGGDLYNSISTDAVAVITVNRQTQKQLQEKIYAEAEKIKKQYLDTDPDLKIEISFVEYDENATVMGKDETKILLYSMSHCPNGVKVMSPDIKDLPQTSSNLGRVLVQNGEIFIQYLVRSSVEAEKLELMNTIRDTFKNYSTKTSDDFSGWLPDIHANINTVMVETYTKLFGKAPIVKGTHGGLECGAIKKKYEDVEMISFGPNIRGPHSPDEKVQISSVQKFWTLLLKTLENIPKMNE